MPPFSPGERLLVLGAGATRGATTSAGRECLPPLNADFFTQLQRITSSKHQKAVQDVIRDVVSMFGSNFSLTLEEYFTQLESTARMARLANRQSAAYSASEIATKRDALMAGLAAVLEVSTDVSQRAVPTCDHHRVLVESLNPSDTVVTFNYDCVMDHALRVHGAGKWSAKYGYTLPKPARIEGTDRWDANPAPTNSRETIFLLKLHGSINWQLPGPEADDPLSSSIKLKQRLYQQRGTPRFTIIPPEWVKNIDDPNFRVLWRNAERAIRTARSIALVGFSFTPTDLHVESLFRIALAGNTNLERVLISNPRAEHRRRIRSVFAGSLSEDVIVRQYDYLEDFAQALARSGW